jgi:hypothetical protein
MERNDDLPRAGLSWLKHTALHRHRCRRPTLQDGHKGDVWKCEFCKKRWVIIQKRAMGASRGEREWARRIWPWPR